MHAASLLHTYAHAAVSQTSTCALTKTLAHSVTTTYISSLMAGVVS